MEKLQSTISPSQFGSGAEVMFRLQAPTVITGAGFCAACVFSCYHIYGTGYFRDKWQLKTSSGKPAAINGKLLMVIKESLRDADLPLDCKTNVGFFVTKGELTRSAGILSYSSNAVVGLPNHFNFHSVEDIPAEYVKLPASVAKADPKAAQKLLKSFLLSDNAKKYAILKELHYTSSIRLWIECFLIIPHFMLSYSIYEFVRRRFPQLAAKPRFDRVVTFSLSALIAATNLLLVFFVINLYFEKDSEKLSIKTKSPDYLDGAIEYHEKTLKRNKAWRKLLGSEGESLYTVEGNEIHWYPCMPYTNKLNYFLSLKDSLQKNAPAE